MQNRPAMTASALAIIAPTASSKTALSLRIANFGWNIVPNKLKVAYHAKRG